MPAHSMHSLAAQALFEGLIVHKIGKAKLAGRVLNTYVPLMEIQVQPLLRRAVLPGVRLRRSGPDGRDVQLIEEDRGSGHRADRPGG